MRRCSVRTLRIHSRRQVQLLQVLIAFLFPRKKFLDALQSFDRFRTHPVLHQDLRLQHQVLEGGGAQGRALSLNRLGGLGHAGEPRGDDLEAVFIDFSSQHFQSLLMTRLIGVHVRGAV